MWPLSRRKAAPDAPPTHVGRLIYAVGDIHGRRDLLETLIQRLRADAEASGEAAPAIIFLGDYIDRGDDSRGVIDLILGLEAESGFEVCALKGNHETFLLDFLDPECSEDEADDDGVPQAWLAHGGVETLLSYGVAEPPRLLTPALRHALREALRAAMPAAHLEFLRRLQLVVRCGDYLFVHAGVRPGVVLEAQQEADLLWIREPFLRATQAVEGMAVVHGHTPERVAHMGAWRIGVDTGAYATGVLTAVRLLGHDRRLIQVGLDEPEAAKASGISLPLSPGSNAG